MDARDWDERYSADDLVWSAEPNVFVAQVAGEMAPGRALDLACGEGRNARWLALQGWRTTAVDFSAVAVDKSRRMAESAGVAVEWICADVLEWEPPAGAFDLVLLAYLQLPAAAMARALGHAADAVADGGSLLVVGHALANLQDGVGGPQIPDVLYEPDDVVAAIPGLEVVRAEHVTREVDVAGQPRRAIDTLVLATRPRPG